MFFSKSRSMIILGFILMLLGVIFPFLMVIHILRSTFFLNFFSYTLSLVGMIVGVVGIAFDFKGRK
jgi:hypothetical protein